MDVKENKFKVVAYNNRIFSTAFKMAKLYSYKQQYLSEINHQTFAFWKLSRVTKNMKNVLREGIFMLKGDKYI